MTGVATAGSLKLVLFGPPGAGKGTQAQLLKERLGIDHVSSGDLFRHHLSKGTKLGELARGYMERGALVPDEVTIEMVLDHVSSLPDSRGFILDGFPRNPNQARALDEALKQRNQPIERVVHICVPDDELIRRLSNRYVCKKCQKPFTRDSISGEPPQRCDSCPDGGEIYQRDDDTPDAVANRLAVFHQETEPVLEFYRDAGLLADIPGEGSIETVNQSVLTALGLTATV